MSVRRTVLAATVVALVASACFVPSRPGPGPGHAGGPFTKPLYAQEGPYAAGVTTLDLGDREVEVWYPAARRSVRHAEPDTYFIREFLPQFLQDFLPPEINPPFETDAYRDVPVAFRGHREFPLVLFSHGAASYRLQSTFLTTHLASWGFVVASPDFLERGLASFLGDQPDEPKTSAEVLRLTVDRLEAAATAPGSRLRGAVDTSEVFPIGHSAGGGASTQFAAEPDASAWVSLAAGASSTATLPDKPSLWMAGANDQVVPQASVESGYAAATGPKRLVVIDGAGHNNAFSDICEIGADGGGVVAIAREAGLPIPDSLARLGEDGCLDPNLPSEQVWPVVRHFVTAQLRLEASPPPVPFGLGAGVEERFPGVDVTYVQAR